MARNFWHKKVNRPITEGDEGKFVVGRGPGGWACGWIVIDRDKRTGGPKIDTGCKWLPPNSQVLNTNSLKIYTFLTDPPVADDERQDIRDPSAKVVRFPDV